MRNLNHQPIMDKSEFSLYNYPLNIYLSIGRSKCNDFFFLRRCHLWSNYVVRAFTLVHAKILIYFSTRMYLLKKKKNYLTTFQKQSYLIEISNLIDFLIVSLSSHVSDVTIIIHTLSSFLRYIKKE